MISCPIILLSLVRTQRGDLETLRHTTNTLAVVIIRAHRGL